MSLADRYDAFLFDLDGVLFRGEQTIEGAPGVLAALHAAGRPVAFVTNNSARTPEEVAAKLRGHGFEADPREVVTSAIATAELLASRGGGSAYVIGERGIREALRSAGVLMADGEPSTVDYVVVGWDRSVDYDKLRTASLLLQRGAALIATNTDRSYPAPDGLWPGAGALVSVLTTTTGFRPEVVGKPEAPLFLTALQHTGGRRPLVIGDRLETDIAGAAALGWDSLLVLSGVTAREDLLASTVRPTHVARDVSALLEDASSTA
jgi:glycerol 3-phosphatase-2